MRNIFYILCTCFTIILFNSCYTKKSKNLDSSPFVQILFLGHQSEHHNSEAYMPILASALIKKGIHFTYTTDLDDLNEENLAKYDGLAIYANHEEISKPQEKALLDFVKSGKGLLPIHAASACFTNSDTYIQLVGAQFKSHGTGTFKALMTSEAKPLLKGIGEFETWDETYVHHQINPNIKVLMERVDSTHREPWTWVNTYGKGKIFYTAYGHDQRTWSNKGFHQLMEKGILWAVGETVSDKLKKINFPEHHYSEAQIPNYEKRDPAPKLQKPLSPEESMLLTQIPVGFELQLFASEPDIINPIAMAWDEKGRLWVIETVDYPNTVRNKSGIGDDRIKICEDTNGDGKADKFTIFADNLNLPTSLVFSKGGIIVAQAPDLLFLKDTDGDNQADLREVIMTGWGTFDTHAVVSNLKYGFDNKIWGSVGYSGYQGIVNGEATKFKQGIFRFDSDGSNLEQLTKTSNNTWGLGFSENNDVFASTANNTHSVFMGIPNKYLKGLKGLNKNGSEKIDGHYAMHPITQKVRQVDVFGGFTAAAGHNLYTARDFPKEYWNRIAFVCEPTGRLIHNAILEQNGSGFLEKDGWNLTASNDNWYGPVHAEVGPDGALWIADWYNFIIQHNPTPPGFENGDGNAHINPLRDQAHGRIYRLKYKGAKTYHPISLSKNEPKGLLKALNSDNLFWRLTAQRLLVERNNKDVVPELIDLIKNTSVDEIGINAAAIHALWALHGLNQISENQQVVIGAVNHPSAGVRKAAIEVLPKSTAFVENILTSGILEDPNGQTQLAALLAVSEMPYSEDIGKKLYEISTGQNIENDLWLSQAVYIATIQHQAAFIDEINEKQPNLMNEVKMQNSETKNPWEINADVSGWDKVKVPGFWEETKIGAIDGTVWFRKEINLPHKLKGKSAIIKLGPIDDSDETWINGIKIGGFEKEPALFRNYKVPIGILKAGINYIVVKVEDTGGDGGFSADDKDLQLIVGDNSYGLAGEWIYWIEKLKGSSKRLPFDKNNSIAKVFLRNYYREESNTKKPLNNDWPKNAQIIELKTIVNEMKFDLSSFEVKAGQAVEIRLKNVDFMQHNLLIIERGALKIVGTAADKMASDPSAASKNYVPDIPQVLQATSLVNPDSEVILRFYAPKKIGEYPFVCTFPGHWRMMNGIMIVK